MRYSIRQKNNNKFLTSQHNNIIRAHKPDITHRHTKIKQNQLNTIIKNQLGSIISTKDTREQQNKFIPLIQLLPQAHLKLQPITSSREKIKNTKPTHVTTDRKTTAIYRATEVDPTTPLRDHSKTKRNT